MYFKTKFLLIIGFVIISNLVYSQQLNRKENTTETEKIYYYRFEGQLSPEVSDNLRNDIMKMLFVSEAKVEYKTEKQAGQVRVWTKEKFLNNDSDFQFNILALNELLTAYNLTPIEYNADFISNVK